MDREKAVEYLTANCECWKDGADVLNELDEDAVVEMAENALVVNAAREAIGDDEVDVAEMPAVLNRMLKAKAKAPPAKSTKVVENEDDDEEEDEEDYPVKNRKVEPMTDEEFLAAAPPAVRRLVENAQRTERRERKALVARLTANINPGKALDRLVRTYDKLDVDDLRAMAAALPVARPTRNEDDELDDDDDEEDDRPATRNRRKSSTTAHRRDADYSGAGYVGNRRDEDDADGPPDQGPLKPVTYNWDAIRADQRGREDK